MQDFNVAGFLVEVFLFSVCAFILHTYITKVWPTKEYFKPQGYNRILIQIPTYIDNSPIKSDLKMKSLSKEDALTHCKALIDKLAEQEKFTENFTINIKHYRVHEEKDAFYFSASGRVFLKCFR